jgi:hypothetical protein
MDFVLINLLGYCYIKPGKCVLWMKCKNLHDLISNSKRENIKYILCKNGGGVRIFF